MLYMYSYVWLVMMVLTCADLAIDYFLLCVCASTGLRQISSLVDGNIYATHFFLPIETVLGKVISYSVCIQCEAEVYTRVHLDKKTIHCNSLGKWYLMS